jgi:hypothetical protein
LLFSENDGEQVFFAYRPSGKESVPLFLRRRELQLKYHQSEGNGDGHVN